ncbi:hypothetical protein AOC03_12085 (plasmid) [Psychrobacter urativorans]|uniref:Spore coat protein U/FanG domain-containing protein n=2 Tax=Psychrobacter urativorans TaxID=45610 RepID=A0A0M4T057_9GAMM|nr:hypothetical protein AOC03_12085 [Psychrobacter urativorans]
MTFNKTLLTATMLTLGGFAAMTGANAADALAGGFNVDLEVEATCVINTGTGDIDLGKTLAGAGASTAALGTEIILNCSKGAVYAISLVPTGANVDGTGVMLGGTGTLEEVAYKLTTDAAGLVPWGGTGNTVGGTALLYATDIKNTVYATVTGSADVSPSTYTDAVVINVSY